MGANPPLTPEGDRLRVFALGLPETHEDNPWGHAAIEVRGKVIVFLSSDDGVGTRIGRPRASARE